jgi:hypothetical protein
LEPFFWRVSRRRWPGQGRPPRACGAPSWTPWARRPLVRARAPAPAPGPRRVRTTPEFLTDRRLPLSELATAGCSVPAQARVHVRPPSSCPVATRRVGPPLPFSLPFPLCSTEKPPRAPVLPFIRADGPHPPSDQIVSSGTPHPFSPVACDQGCSAASRFAKTPPPPPLLVSSILRPPKPWLILAS